MKLPFDPSYRARERIIEGMLNKNYNQRTKTLALSQKMGGFDFVSVLEQIRTMHFFYEIEHLILSHNHFACAFNSDTLYIVGLFPPNLRTLDLSNNGLSGSDIPWSIFLTKLETLYLQNNCFGGNFANFYLLHLLPKQLKSLCIYGNQFEGFIDWKQLPNTLGMLLTSKHTADLSMATMPRVWKRENAKGNYARFVRQSEIESLTKHIKDTQHIERIDDLSTNSARTQQKNQDCSPEFMHSSHSPDTDLNYSHALGIVLVFLCIAMFIHRHYQNPWK